MEKLVKNQLWFKVWGPSVIGDTYKQRKAKKISFQLIV